VLLISLSRPPLGVVGRFRKIRELGMYELPRLLAMYYTGRIHSTPHVHLSQQYDRVPLDSTLVQRLLLLARINPHRF